MSLKQLNDEDRIIFLQRFSEELVVNSAKDENLKRAIEKEKIKRRYINPEEKEITFQDFSKSLMFEPEYKKADILIPKEKKKIIFERAKPPLKIDYIPTIGLEKALNARFNIPIQEGYDSTKDFLTQQFSGGYSIRKIDNMLRDHNVQLIECPGSGKNILVKVRNRINITRIVLNESDIENIVNYFSEMAKIPVIGGILKAAVDDLIISAVMSKYVGSRFIITKKSPYSLIEGTNSIL